MLGVRAWEMGNTPTLWETESSSNGASDCVGAVTNFFSQFFRFVLEQQQMCVLCHLRVREWDHSRDTIRAAHSPRAIAGCRGERRNFLSSFQNIFSPPLLFSEKCWPLVSRARLWLSVKSLYPGRLIMTGLRGCLSSYIIITPKLEHRGQSGLSGAGERQTQFWENNLGSQCISCESLEYLNTPLGNRDETWC